MVSQKEMKKKYNFGGFYYPLSLLTIVFGVSMIIGWTHWLLDLYGVLILVLGVVLNVIVKENETKI